jgi:hypothetical protein
MKTIAAILLLCGAAVAQIQHAPIEHAPTDAQCQADAKAWGLKESYSKVSYAVLAEESDYLLACPIADNTYDREQINQTILILVIEEKGRLGHYITRHAEGDDFYKEDGKGKR